MIECTNLLLKYLQHLNQSAAHALQEYLTKYLLPVLRTSNEVDTLVLEAVLEGVTEIIEVSPQTVMGMDAAIKTILEFQHYRSSESTKRWLGLVYDVVSKDNEE